MSIIKNEILEKNNQYVQHFDSKSRLPMPPSKKTAILTCMDARLDTAKFTGLTEGEAHVIRNAGGRASDDAIRSLVISHKLLGTDQWFVIHHTDCGMEAFTNEIMSELLAESLETAVINENGWKNVKEGRGSVEGRYINWLTIRDQSESVIGDVTRIRNHPLVSPTVSITGFIFDVKSGRLIEVRETAESGKPADLMAAR